MCGSLVSGRPLNSAVFQYFWSQKNVNRGLTVVADTCNAGNAVLTKYKKKLKSTLTIVTCVTDRKTQSCGRPIFSSHSQLVCDGLWNNGQ